MERQNKDETSQSTKSQITPHICSNFQSDAARQDGSKLVIKKYEAV